MVSEHTYIKLAYLAKWKLTGGKERLLLLSIDSIGWPINHFHIHQSITDLNSVIVEPPVATENVKTEINFTEPSSIVILACAGKFET